MRTGGDSWGDWGTFYMNSHSIEYHIPKKTWDDPNAMKFYNDGLATFPYLSDGMWFMTQHKRWGLLKEHPDYLAVAKKVNNISLYKEAATASKTPLPKSDMRSSKLFEIGRAHV